MDTKVINILVIFLSGFTVFITLTYILWSDSRIKRTRQKQLQELQRRDASKESDLMAYNIDTDTWKSLQDIVGGLRELSNVRDGADKAFLSVVHILITSFLQSLGVKKGAKSSADYPNISFMLMINDTDKNIQYHNRKNWEHETITGDDFYQNDVTVSRNENEYFEYQFTGTGINCFVGILSHGQTLIDIYFDDIHIGEKKLSGTYIPTQQSIFQRNGLKRKEHTIKVVLKEGTLALDAIGIYV